MGQPKARLPFLGESGFFLSNGNVAKIQVLTSFH